MTDSIIKQCLNEDSKKDRGNGLYFTFASDNPFPDFNFQGFPLSLEDVLGRLPNEDEIEKAKSIIPYSVDYVYCSSCENHFTKIENAFIEKILPLFRGANLDNQKEIILNEEQTKITRLFFLLQVWRSSICDKDYSISTQVQESLRPIILNSDSVSLEELNQYPLLITYLQTLDNDYTSNTIDFIPGQNPSPIIMNDFIIQFYENKKDIRYIDLYGINNKDMFNDLVAKNDNKLSIQVLSNQERLLFQESIMKTKSKQILNLCQGIMKELHFISYGNYPSKEIENEYIQRLTNINYDDVPIGQHLSMNHVKSFTVNFIKNLGSKK